MILSKKRSECRSVDFHIHRKAPAASGPIEVQSQYFEVVYHLAAAANRPLHVTVWAHFRQASSTHHVGQLEPAMTEQAISNASGRIHFTLLLDSDVDPEPVSEHVDN